MPRANWKAFIRLSLVSVPVQGYTAADGLGGDVQLHQLHEPCHSRIQYRKFCPVHGEVSNDEIVKGYEFAKGQYAVIDLDELDKLRPERSKAIDVDTFITTDQVDPMYYAGRTYYLAPDGPAGQKPYALLQRALAEEGLMGVGQMVLFKKEHLLVLRPVEDLLCMNLLIYDGHLRKPQEFAPELSKADYSAQELKLTKTLIEASIDEKFDLARYEDLYSKRLAELVDAKVQGKEVVAVPEVEAPAVINLMDALKASVKRAKEEHGKRPAAAKRRAEPAKKKMAGSQTQRKTARKKKQTG